MTPREAENFYEEDEDPAEIFARFDAADRQEGSVTWWQVLVKLPDDARVIFGVPAADRETATAEALRRIEDVLVPVDLEVTEIPPPGERLSY